MLNASRVCDFNLIPFISSSTKTGGNDNDNDDNPTKTVAILAKYCNRAQRGSHQPSVLSVFVRACLPACVRACETCAYVYFKTLSTAQNHRQPLYIVYTIYIFRIIVIRFSLDGVAMMVCRNICGNGNAEHRARQPPKLSKVRSRTAGIAKACARHVCQTLHHVW